MYQVYNDEYLMHHGIKGMHWGVRRYQNPDGSLTSIGKKRASKSKQILAARKDLKKNKERYEKEIQKMRSEYEKNNDYYHIDGVHIDDIADMPQEKYWKLQERADKKFEAILKREQKYNDLKRLAETKTGKEKALEIIGGAVGGTLALAAFSSLPVLLKKVGGK